MDLRLENKIRNTAQGPTRVGHIFGNDGYSLCWDTYQWHHRTDKWFWPGIVHPQSEGLGDGSRLCLYCWEKTRKRLKPRVGK